MLCFDKAGFFEESLSCPHIKPNLQSNLSSELLRVQGIPLGFHSSIQPNAEVAILVLTFTKKPGAESDREWRGDMNVVVKKYVA